MNEQFKNLLAGMADAGCSEEEIQGAGRLIEARSMEELVKHLKRCRAVLLDRMHESQKRVDCMDYLIRQVAELQKK